MGNQPSRREHAHKPAGEKPFEKDARILIIGGGPSGVHMAHLLKKHGHHNITILEQNDEVGGKAKTLYTPESGDMPQDMGAVHIGATFKRMIKLVEEYGSELVKYDGNSVSEVYCPELRKKQGSSDPKKPVSMLKYCFDQEEVLSLPKPLWCLPSFAQAPAMLVAIKKYIKLHRRIFGVYEYGLPPPLDNKNLELINMTFKKFLETNDLAILIPMLTLCFTFQGYGLMEEAPALYGLWWSTPGLMEALLENKPVMMIQKLGMQHLFKNIVARDGLKVITKAKILEINRNSRDRSKPVEVKALVDGEKQTFEADFLIIAIPAHRALEVMRDPTEIEKEVFATLQSKYVVSTLYSSKVIRPEEKGTAFYPELLTRSQAGRRSGERITSRGMYPDKLEDPNGRRVATAYQYYLTGVQDNDVADYLKLAEGKPSSNDQLLHDLEEDGHKEVKILATCSFEYSPNFSQEAVHKGYPWKVLEFQGRNRTWYIGSSVSYESTEDVVSYNHLLLKIFNYDEQ